jgi:hypothetical protein
MKLTRLVPCAVFLFACFPAAAGLLYTTFAEPGNGYTTTSFGICGPTSGCPEQEYAQPFDLASSATLTELDLVVAFDTNYGGGTNSLVASIVTDNNGSPGSTVLESWTFAAPSQAPFPITTLTSVANPTLLGGTPYWLIIAPGASDTPGNWFVSSYSDFGSIAESTDGGAAWTIERSFVMAFDLQGNASSAPEPSTFALLLLPLAWLAARWFHNSRRTQGDSVR